MCKKEQGISKNKEKKMCKALKEKIKSSRERRGRRVTERFCNAALDRPKLQNSRILKTKAKRR
ncbi:hypothetical protein MTR67_027212 [Solanum verrucosum]|uniref:Uncharacterized protein n=1 Tax=Solanum verrucosum TaxID=315347 RepID=A0AAF0R4M0_SOLVR|nr:hypothetical protein MTR67_027212 [Solanum verrucosum]